MEFANILVRATNWLGDAVMSLPALRLLRERFPAARITILAMPWVADLYGREPFCDELIPWLPRRGFRDLGLRWRAARDLAARRFDAAILLPNSFDAALAPFLARIPVRIGYARDGRAVLLTHAVAPPRKGEIAPHESWYYVELLRRSGVIPALPERLEVRLDGAAAAAEAGRGRLERLGLTRPLIGVSPGAAFGGAKRYLPERFAEAATSVARRIDGEVALFGSRDERALCETVAAQIEVPARNFAGETTLAEFIELAAACRVFLTNDSGAMHVAGALGVPTVAVFGATNPITTGPTQPKALYVIEPVDCAPCLLRECPIDHRCMTRIPASRVAETALELLK